MHSQTSTGNSSGPAAPPFSILLSVLFTSSPLTQFTSSPTTSAPSVPGSLSPPRSIVSQSTPPIPPTLPPNLSQHYHLHLLHPPRAAHSPPRLPTQPIGTAHPHLSPFPIQHTNRHAHILAPSLPHSSFLCISFQHFYFLFCPMPPCLPPFSYTSLNFLTPPPRPLPPPASQMSLPEQPQLSFPAFPMFCPTHQATVPTSPRTPVNPSPNAP